MLEQAGILKKMWSCFFSYIAQKSVAGSQSKSVDRKGSRKLFEPDKVVQGTVVPDHLVDCPDSKHGPTIVLLLNICPQCVVPLCAILSFSERVEV